MKKIVLSLICLLCISLSFTIAQTNQDKKLFSDFELNILGGINSPNFRLFGPSLRAEYLTYLTNEFQVGFSIGYFRSYEQTSIDVRTYSEYNINNVRGYQAVFYTILKKGYDNIPISICTKYSIGRNTFSPYLLFGAGINFPSINNYNSKTYYFGSYNSINDLPLEYQSKPAEEDISTPVILYASMGTKIRLTKAIALDLRYLFNYDSKIINTHQFFIGFSF